MKPLPADPSRPLEPKRAIWPAVKNGLRGRCPKCGQGKIFTSYLKVADTCSVCGEELHHHRADDMPPYVTMFIAGHIMVACVLEAQEVWPEMPTWAEMTLWPLLAAVLCLGLLPIVKGALIAYQWALRMHGFGPESVDDKGIEPRRLESRRD